VYTLGIFLWLAWFNLAIHEMLLLFVLLVILALLMNFSVLRKEFVSVIQTRKFWLAFFYQVIVIVIALSIILALAHIKYHTFVW
jgi:fluoride ion exporter CrcB/FEX